MDVTKLVSNKYFEIFEIHTMPQDVIVYTVKLTKKVTQHYKDGIVGMLHHIPKGAMTLVFRHKNDKVPEIVNFVPATKSLNKIHKRIDKIREALNNSNLKIIHNAKNNT